jgi:Papain family cysteine protease
MASSLRKKYGTYLVSNKSTQDQINDLNQINNKAPFIEMNIPNSFDGRTVWKNLMSDVPNQSDCLSCWVFTSLFVFSSRLSIYTNGKYKLNFSPAKMIFGKNNDNDKLKSWDDIKKQIGNKIPFDFSHTKDLQNNVVEPRVESLLDAWQYLYRFGVCESTCAKDSLSQNVYSSIQLFGDSYDGCPSSPDSEMISHRIGGYYYVPGAISKSIKFPNGDESMIRRDIYHWGPACTAMKIFADFLSWDGKGIYQWDKLSPQMSPHGHSVVLVGWGEENGVKYWIVCNTWGKDWGENGYFRIVRGINHCEIEENVFNGYPMLPGMRLHLEFPIRYSFDDFVMRSLWGIKDNGYKQTTYERIILGKKDPKNFDQYEYLYAKEFWPDFSKLIAGDLSTIVYNIKGNVTLTENFRKFVSRKYNGLNSSHILNILIGVILVAIVLKIFYKIRK